MDVALTAVVDEDSEHMGLYTQTQAARVAVNRERTVAGVRKSGPATIGPLSVGRLA
jgi:hypothetical protein